MILLLEIGVINIRIYRNKVLAESLKVMKKVENLKYTKDILIVHRTSLKTDR